MKWIVRPIPVKKKKKVLTQVSTSRMPRDILWLVIMAASVMTSVDTSHLRNELDDSSTPGTILLEELIANNTKAVSIFDSFLKPVLSIILTSILY